MDKLSILSKCSLFKGINQKEIEILLSQIDSKEENFGENELIFSPVQKADRIGIILSGSVDIQKIFPNGKVVLIKRKDKAEIIGEPSIFSKYEYYPIHACTYKSAKILYISKPDILKLFKLNEQFLLNYLESISNATLVLKHKIGLLAFDSIQKRIAGYLINYLQNSEENIVELPFSKSAWAEYIDVSRTSLSRELRKLEKDGIISFNKNTIIVKNIEKLHEIIAL